MPIDLGSTLARLRSATVQAGRTVAASAPVSAARRRPRVTAGILVALAVAAGGATWLAVQGLPDWTPFSPRTLAEHVEHARANPRDARAQRDLGHAQWAAGRPIRALASYERALALDAGAADAELVENAVASFGRKEQDRAAALIAKHKLAAAAKGLEPLTRSPRYAVRWGALRTLQKIGKDPRPLWVNAYVADLSSPDCDVRRRAMEKLATIGDRSALAAVRRAKAEDESTGGWFRGTCLGERDVAAEKAILARR